MFLNKIYNKIRGIYSEKKKMPLPSADATSLNNSMKKVPDTVWLQIFSHVPFEQRMRNLRLVSKRWNEYVFDYSLFNGIIISYNEDINYILNLIDLHNEFVRSVTIELCKGDDINKVVYRLSKCENLKQLTVLPATEKLATKRKNSHIGHSVDIPRVCNAIRTCNKLEELHLNCVRSSDAVTFVLQEINSQLPGLKKLTLKWYITNYTYKSMQISPFTNLKELRVDVGDRAVDYDSIKSILEGVTQNLTVLKLYGRDNRVSEVITNDLLELISKCSLIEKLTIKYSRWSFCHNVTDSGFRNLLKLERLESLVLHCLDRVSYKAYKNYFSQPHVVNFHKIELRYCSYFTDDIINFIKEEYPHLTYKGDGKFRKIA